MLVSLAPCRCVSLPLLLLAPDCWTEARLLLGSCQSGRPGIFWVKRCPHDAHDSSGRHGPMMLVSLAPCRCVSLPLLLLAPDCRTQTPLCVGSCQSG